MMRKLFDQFIDKPGSGFEDIAPAFSVQPDSYLPVRLVSHHLRLLGVLYQWPDIDYLVLVDYDDTKT